MSRLLDLLRRLIDGAWADPRGPAGPDSQPEPDDGPATSASPYARDACDRVSVSEGIDTCPGRGRQVERIPSGTELGFRSDRGPSSERLTGRTPSVPV